MLNLLKINSNNFKDTLEAGIHAAQFLISVFLISDAAFYLFMFKLSIFVLEYS